MNAADSIVAGIDLNPDLPAAEPKVARRMDPSWRVIMTLIGGSMLVVMAVAFVGDVRESWRKHCDANLKQIGLAFHEYHEAHGHFPAPALSRGDGTPLLSWRVALLPQLGYQSLYERFHLDEPWDSPHNRALLAEMPREFGCPAAVNRRDGRTGYLVVVGPEMDAYGVNTPFDTRRGVDLREITDGASSTILVLETDTLVAWTRPDDLRWSPGGPLPRLSSPHKGGAHAIFADSATRFLKDTTQPNILLAILTVNGGELIGGG